MTGSRSRLQRSLEMKWRTREFRMLGVVLIATAWLPFFSAVALGLPPIEPLEPGGKPTPEVLAMIRLAGGQSHLDEHGLLPRITFSWSLENPKKPRYADLSVLELCPDLKHIRLSQCAADASWVDALLRIEKLESLSVEQCPLTDAEAEKIARLKNLRELSIIESELTDDGVKHLASLEKLENLTLIRASLTDESLKSIAALPNLKNLTISGKKLTLTGIEHLRNTRIERFGWSNGRDDSRKKMPYYALLKHLKVFGLDTATNEELAKIAEMTSLEELYLGYSHLTDEGFAPITKLKNLQKLTLMGLCPTGKTRITDEGMKHVAKLTKLRELDIRLSNITVTGFAELKALPELERLLVTSTPIADADVIDFRGFAKLNYVEAYGFDEAKIRWPPMCRIDTFD
jgi:internalin A